MKEVTFYILDVGYVNDSTCNVRIFLGSLWFP